MVGYLQTCYRSRLYRVYVLNASTIFSYIFKLVKPLLDKITQDKINISKEGQNEKFWEHMNKSQVEKKFGGHVDNLTTNFW